MKRIISLFIVPCLLFVFVAGCGPKGSGLNTQFVEGIITLDGNPCGSVSITFVPKTEGSGERAGGLSNDEGRYTLSSASGDPGKGALEGEYIVLVSKTESVDLATPTVGPSGDPVTTEVRSVLHESYRNERQTPLSATVEKGKNKIDFALESRR